MFCKRSGFFIVLSLIVALCMSGCETYSQMPKERDDKFYGIAKGRFRGHWWHYYERALSFAEGGFLEDAESDLRKAIHRRRDDKWRARTYGMHFVDYFPHCELGIVKYRQGDLGEAVRELETALKTAKNAKAEYYLDLARKDLIHKEQSDKSPPEIRIESPHQSFSTKAFSVAVRGIAGDDTFVRDISINGKKVRIDVSAKEISFNEEVPLSPGENKISIRAADLIGKESHSELVVNVDRLGPVISVDSVSDDSETGIVLKGYASDNSGLAELMINGRKIVYSGEKTIRIDRAVPFSQAGQTELEIKARDLPGNITSAKINLADFRKASKHSNLLAQNTVSDSPVQTDASPMLAQPNENDPMPTVITLHNSDAEQTSYLDYAIIDGEVDGDVKHLFAEKAVIVEGKTISKKRYEPYSGSLPKTPGKKFFNFLIDLEKNEQAINFIEIKAEGHGDFENVKKVAINWRKPNALKKSSRLKMAVCNFFNEKDKETSSGFESYLVRAMRIHKRFYKPHYLRLDISDLEEDKARAKAKEKGFDCILFGNIMQENNSVHIYAWLQDTKTEDLIVENIDVYENSLDNRDKLKSLSELMNYKLTDELPLVKGLVKKVESNTVSVNIGRKEKVREGMRLLVYELDPRDNTLGQAKVDDLDENDESLSYADLMDKKQGAEIKVGHNVITR